MPKSSLYALIWSQKHQCYELQSQGRVCQCFRPGEEPAFIRWLEEHTCFAFVGQAGRLSVSKEGRSGANSYWYATRGQNRRTHQRYLGATKRLTFARLEQAAKELSGSSLPSPFVPGLPGQRAEQSVTLLVSQLSPPRLPLSLVGRSRLLSELEAVHKHPLTLISASAGSGKTTLLSTWVAASKKLQASDNRAGGERESAIAWLSLEELDNDPIRFWTSCIAALRTCLPRVGQMALAMLHAQEAYPLPRCLSALLHEVEQMGREQILILDDYHVISDQTLGAAMLFFLDHLPANLHLVLATRTDPELPLSRLRMHGQMLEIRGHDLRFTQEEATRFLRDRMGLPLSDDEVITLQTRTEGWIAGLQLAALSLRKREDLPLFVKEFGGSHRFVFDYVRQDILARLPDTLQDFMLQTSTLTRMNAALCQAITTLPTQKACQERLEALERANLFVVPLDEQRQWYRYHDLFREVLLAQLHVNQPELVQLLHLRAARWYEAQGELREAITHALAGPDYSYAASLMEQAAPHLLLSGEVRAVLNWVLSLPDAVLCAHIRLTLSAALHLLNASTIHPAGIIAEVEQAITRLEGILCSKLSLSLSDAEVELFQRRLRLLRAFIDARAIIKRGDAERLRQLAQEMEALSADSEVSWNLLPLFIASWLPNFYPEESASIIPRLLIAKQQVMQATYYPSMIRIATLLGQAYLETGQLKRAKLECLEALSLIEQYSVHTSMAGYLYLNLFDISYAQNRLEEAADWLHHLLSLAQDWRETYLLALGEISSVRLAVARGDFATAHQALQRMEVLVEQEGYTPSVLWEVVIRVHYWLASQNQTQAEAWATRHMCAPDASDRMYSEEALMLVRVLLAMHQYSQAVEMLSRWRRQLDRPPAVAITIHFLALSMVALSHAGKREEAMHSATRLFALTEPEGLLRVYLDAGPLMKQALKSLLEIPRSDAPEASAIATSRPYVSHLLAAFEQEERKLAQVREGPSACLPNVLLQCEQNSLQHALLEPLTLQEQRVLRLLVAGQTYAEIAEMHCVSTNTIKTQVSSIYRKLGVSRRAEAIAVSQRLHLPELDSRYDVGS